MVILSNETIALLFGDAVLVGVLVYSCLRLAEASRRELERERRERRKKLKGFYAGILERVTMEDDNA